MHAYCFLGYTKNKAINSAAGTSPGKNTVRKSNPICEAGMDDDFNSRYIVSRLISAVGKKGLL